MERPTQTDARVVELRADPRDALQAAHEAAARAGHPDFGGRPVFSVLSPAEPRVPLVFGVPHAGRDYPERFQASSRLDPLELRRSEDSHVDELFAGVVPLGATMLVAHFPRAWLDVNREPYELDPRMFDGALPPYANIRSTRVAGGLGTVPRLVAEGRDIYRSRLPVAEALERIERVYKPYHDALRRLVEGARERFGRAVLVDCHSMPSVLREGEAGTRPDMVVGDRYGTASARVVTELAVGLLRERGFTVARNKPYAGGFITEHYGRPAQGLHAVQVEINRGIYMDEATQRRSSGFTELQNELTGFCADFMARVETALDAGGRRLEAAE